MLPNHYLPTKATVVKASERNLLASQKRVFKCSPLKSLGRAAERGFRLALILSWERMLRTSALQKRFCTFLFACYGVRKLKKKVF